MSLWARVSLEQLTPARLWAALEPDLRVLAARSAYTGPADQAAARREADRAIAMTLRFRDTAVRQLPVEKRVTYIARNVRADDSLAATLLVALHLQHRQELLGAFLDALAIPHSAGVIDAEHRLEPPTAPQLAAAVDGLYARFPAEQVEVYLASLLAMDPESWSGLVETIEQRRAS
ncbi:MAG TPA: hypothetical protein VJS92_06795 [Candidatus Polarisedimenticolaceae bacterium]|nr:hypothetical protein [Candidatus Polarisedimenticolaceae bacterium]